MLFPLPVLPNTPTNFPLSTSMEIELSSNLILSVSDSSKSEVSSSFRDAGVENYLLDLFDEDLQLFSQRDETFLSSSRD